MSIVRRKNKGIEECYLTLGESIYGNIKNFMVGGHVHCAMGDGGISGGTDRIR